MGGGGLHFAHFFTFTLGFGFLMDKVVGQSGQFFLRKYKFRAKTCKIKAKNGSPAKILSPVDHCCCTIFIQTDTHRDAHLPYNLQTDTRTYKHTRTCCTVFIQTHVHTRTDTHLLYNLYTNTRTYKHSHTCCTIFIQTHVHTNTHIPAVQSLYQYASPATISCSCTPPSGRAVATGSRVLTRPPRKHVQWCFSHTRPCCQCQVAWWISLSLDRPL